MTHSIKTNRKKNGYAILELLFYVAFFSILSLVIINAMIIMSKSFKETSIQGELSQSANIMERISREIRQAHEINSISSDDLKLDTTDSAGAEKMVEFALLGGNVEFFEKNILVGNLNSSSITVTDVVFTEIITEEGKAVKILLTVKSKNDSSDRTVDFYDTVVLRGSY